MEPMRRSRWLHSLRPTLLGFLAGLLFATCALLLVTTFTTIATQTKNVMEGQKQENKALEDAFRGRMEDFQHFLVTTGYDAFEGESFNYSAIGEIVTRELETANAQMSPPLPPEELNCRTFIRRTLEQKKALEVEIRATQDSIGKLKADFETERQDTNLQAAIYIKKIERLEQRITDLENAAKGAGK
jgi:hypothetical protein